MDVHAYHCSHIAMYKLFMDVYACRCSKCTLADVSLIMD